MKNSTLRILIVGINYSPEHAGIGPYTSTAAEHLASLGHSVTVFSGVPHYPSWSVPPRYRWHLTRTESIAGVTVHRLRHFVPRSQSVLRRGIYELTFAAQVFAQGWKTHPDVVLAVVPGLMSATAAAHIARRSNAKYVVWLQDSVSAAAVQSGIARGQYVARAVAFIEHWVLRRADRVVIVSDAFRQHTDQAGVEPRDVATIRNWSHVIPATKDPQVTRGELGWAPEEIIVLHTGNMGLKQDLASVADAGRLAHETRSSVRFVLMGDGSQRAELEEKCRSVANVTIVNAVSEGEYGNVLAAADVLLISERKGVLDMSLPSKLTSYLASGRPIVAAVDPHGSTASEVTRSGGGVVTESQTSRAVLNEVIGLANDPERATAFGIRGKRYAKEELSRHASLGRLAELLVSTEQPNRPSITRGI